MANHASALKRHRQSLVRRAHNRHYITMMRNTVKKFQTLASDGGDVPAIEAAFSQAEKVIRRVAGKGIVHKRTADRKVSRLAKRLNSLRKS